MRTRDTEPRELATPWFTFYSAQPIYYRWCYLQWHSWLFAVSPRSPGRDVLRCAGRDVGLSRTTLRRRDSCEAKRN